MQCKVWDIINDILGKSGELGQSIRQSEFSGVKIDCIGLRKNGYELYGQMSPYLQLKDLDIGHWSFDVQMRNIIPIVLMRGLEFRTTKKDGLGGIFVEN